MDLSESQVNIVVFSVEMPSFKGGAFWLDIAEFRIKVFGATMLSLGTLQYLGNPTIGIENYVLYH